MMKIYSKYKETILYIVFGGLTTLVNIVAFYILYNIMSFDNVPSNIIGWIVAVLFAYITNKIWVFDSKSFEGKVIVYEMVTFFGARILTGFVDISIMFVGVDIMGMKGLSTKIISNLIVIILNYIFSKLVIFKKTQ